MGTGLSETVSVRRLERRNARLDCERVNLASSTVLLTGATGGIGHAIARAFAARGASLVLSGRRTDVLEPLAAEVRGRLLAADLGDRGAVSRLATDAGAPDVVVFNAALPASGQLLEYSEEQLDRALEVNLRAPIALTRALVPTMVRRGRGHIVYISSLQGKAAAPRSSLYSATKFGLRGFALSLREDLWPYGVGVSVVLPGFIRDAGMFADSGAKLPPGIGTRTPDQVATAVIRAIERNRAETSVAPLGLRVGSALAGLAPQIAAEVSRRMGSDRIAKAVSDTQVEKR
jgi:short-subunit dehydrogenase